MQISSYTVGIGFKVDKRQLTIVDKQMKQLEKSMAAMSKRLQTNLGKTFVLPELKVKKFKFDGLALQRGAQMELNRVGRLLELKVGNVRLDQNKITQQFQNVFQRAANNARVNVKTVAGTGGGGNPFAVYPSASYDNNIGSRLGLALPRLSPGTMGAAGLAAAGVFAGQKVGEAQQLMSKRELERLQLEISVGGSRERRDSASEALIGLANKLGVAAETQVDGFTKFMKQGQLSMKLSAQNAFDLYANMGIATRGNGGDEQSMQRQAYALQQIGGLGYLRAEELNSQLADSNPAIRSFIIKAWEERTGQSGVEKFLKAMSKREVSFNDVMHGYELSAKEASTRVKELANSIAGEKARLQNSRFAEELERSKGEMTTATRQFVEAQQKLHASMEPLRDAFYKIAAAGTSLAARFIGWSGEKLTESPAMNGKLSVEQMSTAPLASSMGRGMLGVPDIRIIQTPQSKFISPLIPKDPEWRKEAGKYMPSVSEMSKSYTNNNHSTNSVNVQPGAFVIQTNATNADQLASELEPHIKRVFRWGMEDVLNSTMLEYPLGE